MLVRHALLSMCLMLGTATTIPTASAQTAGVQLYAAGSLREALTEVARNFETESGQKVVLTFGASGLLRERIEKGEPAQVFASADIDHPQRLTQAGNWRTPRVFARNLMCALTAPSVNASPDTLLDTLLLPAIRVGTFTPKADPSGDCAWEIFAVPTNSGSAHLQPSMPRRSSSQAQQTQSSRQPVAALTPGLWTRAKPTCSSPIAPTLQSSCTKYRA